MKKEMAITIRDVAKVCQGKLSQDDCDDIAQMGSVPEAIGYVFTLFAHRGLGGAEEFLIKKGILKK